MKRKFKTLFVVAAAFAVSYQAYGEMKKNESPELVLANVEALAAGEYGSISDCEHYCQIKPGYTCIIIYGDGIQGTTCPGYGKKDQ